MDSSELKFFDSIGSTSTTYTGGTTDFTAGLVDFGQFGGISWPTGLAQGTGGSNRIGNSICARSLQYRFTISIDVTKVQQYLRMIILVDHECEGATPAMQTQVLAYSPGTTTSLTAATGLFEAPLSPQYFGRFKILKDQTYELISPSTICQSHTHIVEDFIDLHDLKIMWDTSGASAIANARNNHIFIGWIYNDRLVSPGTGVQTVTTANPPNISGFTRLRYLDG